MKQFTDSDIGKSLFTLNAKYGPNFVVSQFSNAVSFASSIATRLHTPLSVFFRRDPFEILCSIVLAVMVDMIDFMFRCGRFAVKGMTHQTMHRMSILCSKIDYGIAVYNALCTQQSLRCSYANTSSDTFHAPQIGYGIFGVLNAWFPNLIRQIKRCRFGFMGSVITNCKTNSAVMVYAKLASRRLIKFCKGFADVTAGANLFYNVSSHLSLLSRFRSVRAVQTFARLTACFSLAHSLQRL